MQRKPGLKLNSCEQAERILALAALLPVTLQPVFATWLTRHSGGAVSNPDNSTLIAWLDGLAHGRAEAEYHLILAEISWLELITESAQVETLQKDVL